MHSLVQPSSSGSSRQLCLPRRAASRSSPEPARRPRAGRRSATPVAAAAAPPQRRGAPPAPGPPIDYLQLLSARARDSTACPPLFLAPMENLADTPMRIALASAAGGFDEACTEFIRVPSKAAHIAAVTRGVTAGYAAAELGPWGIPLGAQIMGSEPRLLAAAAARLAFELGAPRIDLNCGCPANSVTGNGAGSTLLKTPERIQALVAALVEAVEGSVPVSVKMRSGFNDASLFEDNALAAQAGGAAFLTLHPRTKAQAYAGGADWSFVARAKRLLSVPVIGNGDVVDVASARRLLAETNCDGIMIGRGAISDPLIFHRIRAAFAAECTASSSSSSSGSSSDGSSSNNGSCSSSSGGSSRAASSAGSSNQGKSGAVGYSSSSWRYDEPEVVCSFLERYALTGPDGTLESAANYSEQARLGRIKKVLKYLFSGQPELRVACGGLLRAQVTDCDGATLLARAKDLVRRHWRQGGPQDPVLVNHMSMRGGRGGGGGAQPYSERQWQPRAGGGGLNGSSSSGGGGGSTAGSSGCDAAARCEPAPALVEAA